MTTPSARFVEDLSTTKTDPILGNVIARHLRDLGIENPVVKGIYDPESAHKALRGGFESAFSHMNIDMLDPSMQDTPRRYADMFIGELTKGLNYEFFPKCTATPAIDDQMVIVKDCRVTSLCEHHLQTIDGVCHIAYIPSASLLGLSKFARLVEFFSRRPQVQERLTAQIFHALTLILKTQDIAVVIDATHYCMKARGAMQGAATTQTNKMGGRFLTTPAAREEFFHGIR